MFDQSDNKITARDASPLIASLTELFEANELSFVCYFSVSPHGRRTEWHNLRPALSEEVARLSVPLIAEERHPLIVCGKRDLAPINLFGSELLGRQEFVEYRELAAAALDDGLKTWFGVPLRTADGGRLIASVISLSRSYTVDEMKILQGDCYERMAAFEKSSQAPIEPRVLSSRERQCLELAAKGMTERESADALDISPHTVHAHIEHAKRRLKARNKLAAVVIGIQRGEIDVEQITSSED